MIAKKREQFINILSVMKIITTILLTCLCIDMYAQTTMRIHHRDGTKVDVTVEDVDSVTFINKTDGEETIPELIGNWLWGDVEAGYYEVLSFNCDKTYTGYDNYFIYGFDTMTYGMYGQVGTLLTLWSNGFGYQRRYTWFIMGLADNALAVMTKMGPFTYYRLQSEVIRMKVNESLSCGEGDSWVFADEVLVRKNGNYLVALSKGTTYVQELIGATDMIVAFKVIIE